MDQDVQDILRSYYSNNFCIHEVEEDINHMLYSHTGWFV